MVYDLHTHSTASDGILSAKELVSRAAERNVNVLALTDHDTVSGLEEASLTAKQFDIDFINGIEISAKWQFFEIHIIGLNIDPNNESLLKGLQSQQYARHKRLESMVKKLKENGIENADEIIQSYKSGDHVGRPTVAKYLVENEHCETYKEAYSSLNRGGDLYVEPNWEFMQYAISWITQAGGVAVLAHPGSYGLNKPGFSGILRDFQRFGGQGVEVCYGPCSKAAISRWAYYARKFKLHGSIGSDFHRPTRGIELGRSRKLPKDIPGVWELFK